MAGVNGVEIKVGQVWRMRNGGVTGPLYATKSHDYPFGDTTLYYTWTANGVRYLEDDHLADTDLIELVKDENGFTIWRGGDQPAETRDAIIEFKVRRGDVITRGSAGLYWDHRTLPGDIVAYKVLARKGPAADSATLAEETLSALGWTFDGQAWVEQPRIDMVPNALDVQVGGTHYKDCAIQPIEYIHANKLGFAEGNVVKYITRHRQKHGADDVKKVIHYCQLLLELEYGATTKEPTHG